MIRVLFIAIFAFAVLSVNAQSFKDTFDSNTLGWTEVSGADGDAIIKDGVMHLQGKHNEGYFSNASVITFICLLCICTCLIFNIRTRFIAFLFCILAANASLTSILVPVLHLTNRKMVSGTAVSIMNFCFFMMVGILGTLSGFLLNLFEPVKTGNVMVYSNLSYLAVFGTFFLLSVFEMYKAMKLSNKY